MADLFDDEFETPTPKPTVTPKAVEADLFNETAPAEEPKPDEGFLSAEAKHRLKAARSEATAAAKAGAGQVVAGATRVAGKAKSTWVPAVKAHLPRSIPKTGLIAGAGVLVLALAGGWLWTHRSATPAPSVAPATASTATPAPAVVLPPAPMGWDVAGMQAVLGADTGAKQAFTCTLNFTVPYNPEHPNAVAAVSIPGLLTALDRSHAIVQASTAKVASDALAAAVFGLQSQCRTLPPPAPAVEPEAVKPPPLPTFAPTPQPVSPTSAPAPVMAPPPARVPRVAAIAPPATKHARVVKAPPKLKPNDAWEKEQDAKLNAFFKQH